MLTKDIESVEARARAIVHDELPVLQERLALGQAPTAGSGERWVLADMADILARWMDCVREVGSNRGQSLWPMLFESPEALRSDLTQGALDILDDIAWRVAEAVSIGTRRLDEHVSYLVVVLEWLLSPVSERNGTRGYGYHQGGSLFALCADQMRMRDFLAHCVASGLHTAPQLRERLAGQACDALILQLVPLSDEERLGTDEWLDMKQAAAFTGYHKTYIQAKIRDQVPLSAQRGGRGTGNGKWQVLRSALLPLRK